MSEIRPVSSQAAAPAQVSPEVDSLLKTVGQWGVVFESEDAKQSFIQYLNGNPKEKAVLEELAGNKGYSAFLARIKVKGGVDGLKADLAEIARLRGDSKDIKPAFGSYIISRQLGIKVSAEYAEKTAKDPVLNALISLSVDNKDGDTNTVAKNLKKLGIASALRLDSLINRFKETYGKEPTKEQVAMGLNELASMAE